MDPRQDDKLNYRELQAIAKKLRLPGNLKYHLLIEVVEARKQGNEDTVRRILEEQKVERAKRKSEKLEGREAAYKHLQIPQEKRPLGRPRKHPLPESGEKAKPKQRSVTDNYLRSLLTMPSHSIDQLIRQTSVPQQTPEPVHNPRKDMCDKQTVSENYELIDRTHHESYQPNMMEGCSIRDYSQFTDYLGKNVSFDMNKQYMNGNARNFDGVGTMTYLEGWNKPSDHWNSFQMRDIFANNSTTIIPQYYPYQDTYTGSNNQTDYSLQYVQDVSNILITNQKQVLPYHHHPQVVYPPSQNYWRGMWEDSGQDHYWRHSNPVNSYQCSSNRGIFPDMPIGYSPSSDTMSATEQDIESLSYSHEIPLPEFKSTHQIPYPLIDSCVALGEGQGVCQLPSETEIPGESFSDESGRSIHVSSSDMDQSINNTDCTLSER